MLSTKLNVALSAGTVNKTSSSIIFGKWNFATMSNKPHSQRKKTCCGNSYPIVENKRLAKFTDTENFITLSRTPNLSLRFIISRNFSSAADFQEKADIFGGLSDKNYEKVVLDEDEKKEEEFIKNEAKPQRRSVPTPGKYAEMIKKHIKTGDLKAGIRVLDQVRQDRNKPDNHMFNLLIRALAMQGDLKRCFSLYNKMKKEDLKVTLATYTSLFNACANCSNATMSLEKLDHLRQLVIEKEVQLNAAHYNAMIKAYGRHGKLFEAFQLVDEMRDKKLTIGISTFNFLLQGTISDTDAGFRHALVVWQLLKRRKLKPDIFTYNLLLRAAKDCKLGNIKIEDLMVSEIQGETQVLFIPSDRTNLLSHPPKVCNGLLLASSFEDPKLLNDTNNDSSGSEAGSEEIITENQSGSELETTETESVSTALPSVNLESYSPETNLLLMGGFKSFVEQMKADKVEPDIKTLTYLMELVPPTIKAEQLVINYAKSVGIELDVGFYNLLIKKRSFRFDYNNALKVMGMMQQDNLEPNIMTWGVLALTCRSNDQAKELFEGMELSGHRLNLPIIGALLNQASNRWLFSLVLYLMEKMRLDGPKPNERIYEMLESFKKKAYDISKDKNCPDYVKKPYWQNGFRKFKLRYAAWLKEMREQEEDLNEKFRKKKQL